jgi:hypothetical protein
MSFFIFSLLLNTNSTFVSTCSSSITNTTNISPNPSLISFTSFFLGTLEVSPTSSSSFKRCFGALSWLIKSLAFAQSMIFFCNSFGFHNSFFFLNVVCKLFIH